MAEGLLRDLACDRFEVASSAYEPSADVCAEAVTAMPEIGIDISASGPSRWTRS
jgi:protein-tyrosine-phosphatase